MGFLIVRVNLLQHTISCKFTLLCSKFYDEVNVLYKAHGAGVLLLRQIKQT